LKFWAWFKQLRFWVTLICGWLWRFWSFAIPKLRLRLPPRIEPSQILQKHENILFGSGSSGLEEKTGSKG